MNAGVAESGAIWQPRAIQLPASAIRTCEPQFRAVHVSPRLDVARTEVDFTHVLLLARRMYLRASEWGRSATQNLPCHALHRWGFWDNRARRVLCGVAVVTL